MADALMSPAVGATMWAATAATGAYCAHRIRVDDDPARVPLMGVAGAFVFAAQMINFTIPGTGSSGHIGGGLLLAILLGPEAAFLVLASVLTVQALFFADGGLLALGANIFNLAVFPAFVAYPLVYKRIAGAAPGRVRMLTGAVGGALMGLTLGAGAVVVETTLSGVSELPFVAFLAVMLPIHLAIGAIEGLATAGVVSFVQRAQPEILTSAATRSPLSGSVARAVVVVLALGALLVGGGLSWFASQNPDGLEWSIERVAGTSQLSDRSPAAFKALGAVQERVAEWGRPLGTGGGGVLGGVLTLALVVVIVFASSRRARRGDR